ncbi:MAG: hypothetical protein AABX54_05485 [Nanoarchaeota archaeon]
MVYPSSSDKFEEKYEDFYLPLRKTGKFITIPLNIVKYKRNFYVHILFIGNLKISSGKEAIEKEFFYIFNDIKRFMKYYDNPNFIKRTISYDFRIGKIKGKYLLGKTMPEKEKLKIARDYRNHLEKNLNTKEISLNDYLNTASICYNSSFKECKNLSSIDMYKKWADGRHDGMLDIKNKDSKEEFSNWQKNHSHGGHPFEIVFSWKQHGIHLYPPYNENPFYGLRVTNYSYAEIFIKMLRALIKNKVPFGAEQINEILDYLTGETYFKVNEYDNLRFIYIPSKEYKDKYFKYIEWDEPNILKLKN